jgi:hypothetical protein
VTQNPIDPRVGVERAPMLPELEGLAPHTRWVYVKIVKDKYAAGKYGSRAVRIAVVTFIWLLGLGTALEVGTGSIETLGCALAMAVTGVMVAGTVGLAWAVSAWLKRLWLRMKVAELRESRGCLFCDYPLPTDSPQQTCPECGTLNDLRERTWWRGQPAESATSTPPLR